MSPLHHDTSHHGWTGVAAVSVNALTLGHNFASHPRALVDHRTRLEVIFLLKESENPNLSLARPLPTAPIPALIFLMTPDSLNPPSFGHSPPASPHGVFCEDPTRFTVILPVQMSIKFFDTSGAAAPGDWHIHAQHPQDSEFPDSVRTLLLDTVLQRVVPELSPMILLILKGLVLLTLPHLRPIGRMRPLPTGTPSQLLVRTTSGSLFLSQHNHRSHQIPRMANSPDPARFEVS